MKSVLMIPLFLMFACSASMVSESRSTVSATASIKTEGPSVIFYTGILKNDRYTAVKEELNVRFEIVTPDRQTILSRSVHDIHTDLAGKFSFYIDEIPPLLDASGNNQSVELRLSVTSLASGSPIKNEMQSVSFRLNHNMGTYKIVRLIGSNGNAGPEMNYAYELPIWSYADQYPDGYLTSHFILCTGREPWEISKIVATGARIMPGYEQKELQRGLKGGFAVGGYKQAN